MGEARVNIAELLVSDDEQKRTPLETRFVAFIRRLSREESDKPVQIVDDIVDLPATAPAASLWRTKTSRDLWMGNGPSQPLSHFVAAP